VEAAAGLVVPVVDTVVDMVAAVDMVSASTVPVTFLVPVGLTCPA